MANKTVDSDAAFKTYVEGLPAYASGTVYMNDDSKYWTFNKQATDKISAMCVQGDDIEVWVYDGTDWITNRIPEVVDNLTSTSTVDALSANQGKVLDEKIHTLKDEYSGRWLKYRGIIFSSDGALLITPSALGPPSRVVNYADTAVIIGVGGATVQSMSISDNGAFVQATYGSYRGIMTIGATLEWD